MVGKGLYDEIMAHPVPFDMRVMKAIKQSPLAIDLCLWLFSSHPSYSEIGALLSRPVDNWFTGPLLHHSLLFRWVRQNFFNNGYRRVRLVRCSPPADDLALQELALQEGE